MIRIVPTSKSLSEFTKKASCNLFSVKFSTHIKSNQNKPKTQHQIDCEILKVDEDCGHEQARSAFIELAKRFHPDGKTKEADEQKFNEVNTAYKNLLKKFAEERHNQHEIEGEYGLYYEFKKKRTVDNLNIDQDEENNKINHTTPQHRRYLSYEGVGTMSQRQKQNQKNRASKAATAVYEHRINQMTQNDQVTDEKSLIIKDKQAARKSKISQGIERMVEDLIQESMAKGEFDNLKGQGKPLKHDTSYNPYIDFTTHKLNQVLIDNGFTPEWILLEKEIRQEIRDIRQNLSKERHKYEENMTATDHTQWEIFLKNMKRTVDELNLKIQKYNLVVPILHKQIFCVDLDREATKALSNFSSEFKTVPTKPNQSYPKSATDPQNETFLGYLLSLIKV